MTEISEQSNTEENPRKVKEDDHKTALAVANRFMQREDNAKEKISYKDSFLNEMMGDVIRIYFASESTLKMINEAESKTDKVIEDLRAAAKVSAAGLEFDVTEATTALESNKAAIVEAMNVAIAGIADKIEERLAEHQSKYSTAVLAHTETLGQSFDARLAEGIVAAKKEIDASVVDAKKEVFSVIGKINSNKLFIYAAFFAACTSVMSGFVMIGVNSYLMHQQQVGVQAQVKDVLPTPPKHKKHH